jgi:gluconolactonase
VLVTDVVTLGLLSKVAPSFKFSLTQHTFLFNEYYHKQTHPLNTVYWDDHSLFASKIEIISDNHDWTEGPVWDKVDQALYFSDTNDDCIYKWTQQEGTQLFLTHSGGFSTGDDGVPQEFYDMIKMPGSNGLAIHDRYLYICQHLLGRIVRIKLDIVTPGSSLSQYEGTMELIEEHPLVVKKFNSPNDLIFDSRGTIWFTDPTYGHHKK